jgi:2-phospho-L-lactate guanylyltransferase
MTGIDKQVTTWALVPLKSPERAKSRLAGVLNPAQRVRLFLALAEQVICSLRATNGIDNVAVVTASAEIAALSRSLHAVPLVQSADAGMSAALDSGLRELQASEPARVLMVPGDLPLISPFVMEAFLAGAGREPGITIVPDRHGVGTNLLLCTPPHAIAPCFGGHSFQRHLAAAAAAGMQAHVLHSDELALDLDEPDDLDQLRSRDDARAAQLFDMLQNVGVEAEFRGVLRRSAVGG